MLILLLALAEHQAIVTDSSYSNIVRGDVADAGFTSLSLQRERESKGDIHKLDVVAFAESQPWSPEDTRFRRPPTTRNLRHALS